MSASAGSASAAPAPVKEPVLRLKVLTFGDSQVGKSYLIKRYCENKFVAKYVSTIGIDYGVRPTTVRGRDVRVNFFDMSGLEANSAMTRRTSGSLTAGFVEPITSNRTESNQPL